MSVKKTKYVAGFSIVEMLVTLVIMLVIMGAVTTLFSRSLSTKSRQSSRTDALTAAQAALNVMSREIANSGYGVTSNGLLSDSTPTLIHYVTNHVNTNDNLNQPGENVTYYHEPGTQSILRHDAHGNPDGSALTSIIINRISSVGFKYYNYSLSDPIGTSSDNPTASTGRVRITLEIKMEEIEGQVKNDKVVLTSDVVLRNSDYMLKNY